MTEQTVHGNAAADYLYNLANLLAQREDAIRGPLEDGPSSEEVLALADRVRSALASADGLTPNEIWQTIESIEAVSDKWVDPEADALGGASEVMEDQAYRLEQLLVQLLPTMAEQMQQRRNLRAGSHAIARTLYREKKNPPPTWKWSARLDLYQ